MCALGIHLLKTQSPCCEKTKLTTWGEWRSSRRVPVELPPIASISSLVNHLGKKILQPLSSLSRWAMAADVTQRRDELILLSPVQTCRRVNKSTNVILNHCFGVVCYAPLENQNRSLNLEPSKDVNSAFPVNIHFSEPSRGRQPASSSPLKSEKAGSGSAIPSKATF